MFRHHAIRVFIVTLVAFASNTLAFNAMHPTQRKRLSLFNHKMMMSNEGDGDSPSSLTISSTGTTTRRTFFHRSVAAAAAGVVGGGAVVVQQQEAAWASGGATAGGAYLLSAKQRYNERVTKGVKELLAVVDGLKKNDVDAARDYFIKRDDAGSWNDLTSAGYLLSNAFRTNSSTPPERLTSVKKYKAFVAEIDSMVKLLKNKKGGSEQAVAAFDTSVEPALNSWLNEIDLPNAKEL